MTGEATSPDPLDADWMDLRATAKVVITADLPDEAIDALLTTYNLVGIATSRFGRDGSKTSLPLILKAAGGDK